MSALRWPLLAVIAAGLLAGAASVLVMTAQTSATTRRSLSAATRFLRQDVTPDGAVGTNPALGTEADAMLLSVAADQPATFDRVWSYTERILEQPGALLAPIPATGTATPDEGAGVEVARALVLAASRFHVPDLLTPAKRLGDAVLVRETTERGGVAVLTAGPAQRAGALVALGGLDPVGLRVLAGTGDAGRWQQLASGAGILAGDAAAVSPFLIPDWERVGDRGNGTPVGSPPHTEGPAAFGMGAQRAPVWFASSCRLSERTVAADAWPFLRDVVFGKRPAAPALTLDGRAVGRGLTPQLLVAAAASARAAADAGWSQRLLDRAAALIARAPNPAAAAWLALSRVLLETSLLTTDCE